MHTGKVEEEKKNYELSSLLDQFGLYEIALNHRIKWRLSRNPTD